MKNRCMKYGMIIIAAVLLVAVAFAGAASAIPVGPIDTTVIKANDDGTFTTDFPVTGAYLISSQDDWQYVINHDDMWDETLVLTNDIEFKSKIKPIMSGYSCPFIGTIYGNGSEFINIMMTDDTGLISYASDGCVLNYVRINNSKFEDFNYLGCLIANVGYASDSGVRICGCSVGWSDLKCITNVGCLVGCSAESNLWINASYVENIYMYDVDESAGGFVGSVSGGNVSVADSRVDLVKIMYREERSNIYDFGGVFGSVAVDSSLYMRNVTVKNVKVEQNAHYGINGLGGLIGNITANSKNTRSNYTFDGCTVENCSLMAYYGSVGGMIGDGMENTSVKFIGNTSSVKWTYIRGNWGGVIFGSNYPEYDNIATTEPPGHDMVYASGIGNKYPSAFPQELNVPNTFVVDYSEAKSAGVGSSIDLRNLQHGVDYGYVPVIYNITNLGAMNGTVTVDKTQAIGYETVHVSAVNNYGYHFAAWNITNNSGGSISPDKYGNFAMPFEDVHVSAHFSANTTVLNLLDGNGASISKRIETFGECNATHVASLPAKDGHTFHGWNLSNDPSVQLIDETGKLLYGKEGYTNASGAWINGTLKNGAELKLDAVFAPNITTVTFHTDTGTQDKLNIFAQPINFSADPVRPGYVFTRWNVSSTGEDLNSSTYVENGNWNYTGVHGGSLDVYANWTANTYNVTFHSNTVPDITAKQEFTYDAAQNLDTNAFIYRGHTFVNWSTNADGTGTNYTNGQSVINLTVTQGGSINLYAQWLANTTTITFHTDTGTQDKLNIFAQPINFSADPVRPGYVFTRWNVSSTGEDLNSSTYVENGNWNYTGVHGGLLDVYANWTLPPYIEVSDWDQLVSAVSVWTETNTMRTIVLTNATDGAYRNTTGTPADYAGIPVTGKITIMPATGSGEIRIDANRMGRVFNVTNSGNLTLVGNGSRVLNVTGGAGVSGMESGGAVIINGGNTTLAAGTKITDSRTGRYGGGVYVASSGSFTLNGGEISGCNAISRGGGVYLDSNGTAILVNGIIQGNSAGYVGNGICIYDAHSLILAGSMQIDNNDIALIKNTNYPTIACAAGFTGSAVNVTLWNGGNKGCEEKPSDWLGKTIIENGAVVKNQFVLSSSYSDYQLVASGSNLVLAQVMPQGSLFVNVSNTGLNQVTLYLNNTNGGNINTSTIGAGVTNITFGNLADGTYNLNGIYETATGNAGVTKLVALTGGAGYVELVFPMENVTSTVNTSGESGVSAPKVTVDGLDKLAAAVTESPAPGKETVFSFNAVGEAYNALNGIQTALKENITKTTPNAEINYLNFTVTNLTRNLTSGDIESVQTISDTVTPMTIYVEYDMTNRENLQVWRVHDGIAEKFRELTGGIVPADGYYARAGTKGVYIYSQNFSTYAVSSTAVAGSSPSSGSSGNSYNYGGSMLLKEGEVAPNVYATTAPTVAPTAKPTAAPVYDTPTAAPTAQPTQTQKSPVPVAGLIAGLGIAALFLRVRK